VASNGGSRTHPAWYLNLLANPELQVQVGAERFDAVARTASAEERPRLWDTMVGVFPTYARYQKGNSREIPVIIVEPVDD
jgi:deazaflavin-dependent oxidoreductase (nitroreductase family)